MAKWAPERRHDHYFRQAKQEGYRSRAAYKLQQMNERYRLIHRGDVVIDLGCAPGSWLQVAAGLAGPEGRAIGIDLQPVEPIPGVVIVQGDMLHPEAVAALEQAMSGRRANVVLSDMAPNTSGNRLRDHLRSMDLPSPPAGGGPGDQGLRGGGPGRVPAPGALVLRLLQAPFPLGQPQGELRDLRRGAGIPQTGHGHFFS